MKWSAPGRKIVLLGMMTRMPVAGNVWLIVQYMIGFRRLGLRALLRRGPRRLPRMLMQDEQGDGTAQAAAFLQRVLGRFDFGGNWAYHALHHERSLRRPERQHNCASLYRSAELILNVHGGTVPLPEHSATAGWSTSAPTPSSLRWSCNDGRQQTIDFLEPHTAFFTWGEKLRQPGLPCAMVGALPVQADAGAGGHGPVGVRSTRPAARRSRPSALEPGPQ